MTASNNQNPESNNNNNKPPDNQEDGDVVDDFLLNCNEIIPGLYLGSEDAAHVSLELLMKYNICSIVCAGFGLSAKYENTNTTTNTPNNHKIKYKKLKCIDLPIYDITKDIKIAIPFIEENLNPSQNRNVLIHCARGKSRSASITTAYLMWKKNISFEEAYYSIVRKKRPLVSVNSGFETQLKAFHKTMSTIKT